MADNKPKGIGEIKTMPSTGHKWIFDPTNDDRIVYPNKKLDPNVPRWTVPNGYSTPGNTPATSQWSTPRHCPNCGGHLYMMDYYLNWKIVLLQCHTCWQVHQDVNLNNDAVYRLIPDLEMQQMMNRKNRSKEILDGGGTI